MEDDDDEEEEKLEVEHVDLHEIMKLKRIINSGDNNNNNSS